MSALEPSFQHLFADLDSAWLREQQEAVGRKRDEFAVASDSNLSNLPGVFFGGQSTYGRPHKAGSKSPLLRVESIAGRYGVVHCHAFTGEA